MSAVKTDDLRQIKGLGPAKIELIEQTLNAHDDPSQVTATQLAEIQGVSERLAKQVVKVVRGQSPTTQPRRKRRATSNGSSNAGTITLTAGFIRKAVRQMMADGDEREARKMLAAVSDLLDDEPVPQNRIR